MLTPAARRRPTRRVQVFNQYSTQSEIFDTMVAPVVDQVLDGFSCTVFAYGQTGTGKTYTMEGVSGERHGWPARPHSAPCAAAGDGPHP